LQNGKGKDPNENPVACVCGFGLAYPIYSGVVLRGGWIPKMFHNKKNFLMIKVNHVKSDWKNAKRKLPPPRIAE
jgi:hypothetical protein